MNATRQIFHQLCADIRRQKIEFLLLISLCVIFIVTDSISAVTFAPSAIPLFQTILIALLLAGLIVVRSVTTDPASGDDAFWKTRPVRKREMLLSKLAIILLVTFILAFSWLIVPFIDLGGNVSHQARQVFPLLLPLLATSFAAGSVSKNVWVCMAVFIFVYVFYQIFGYLVFFASRSEYFLYDGYKEFINSPTALYTMTVGALLVGVLQYLRRATLTHFLLFLFFLSATLAIALYTTPKSRDVAGPGSIGAEELYFAAEFQTDSFLYSPNSTDVDFELSLNPRNFPNRTAFLHVEWEAGGVFPLSDPLARFPFRKTVFPGRLPESEILVGFLPGYRPIGGDPRTQTNEFSIYRDHYDLIAGKAVEIQGDLQGTLAELVMLDPLPLNQRTKIAAFGIKVDCIVSKGTAAINCTAQINAWEVGTHQRLQMILINPKRKEVVLGESPQISTIHRNFRRSSYTETFSLRREIMIYDSDPSGRPSKFQITDEWLEDAELRLITYELLGRIRTIIKSEEALIVPEIPTTPQS